MSDLLIDITPEDQANLDEARFSSAGFLLSLVQKAYAHKCGGFTEAQWMDHVMSWVGKAWELAPEPSEEHIAEGKVMHDKYHAMRALEEAKGDA